MHVCLHVFAHVFMCTHTCTCVFAHVCECGSLCICACMFVCVFTRMCVHVCTCLYVCVCMWVRACMWLCSRKRKSAFPHSLLEFGTLRHHRRPLVFSVANQAPVSRPAVSAPALSLSAQQADSQERREMRPPEAPVSTSLSTTWAPH